MSNFFYSLLSFVVALFFIMLGVFALLISLSPDVRTDIITFVLEDSVVLYIFGISFILIGLGIVFNVILGLKRHAYYIKSKNLTVRVDEGVVQDYLNTYWKQLFPHNDIANKVTIKRNKVHIVADLPYMPISEQKATLERIQNDLDDVFSQTLGYRNEYLLNISFKPANKSTSTKFQ